MILYDWTCDTWDLTGEFLTDRTETPTCPVCRKRMKMVPSIPHVLMGPTGAYGYYDETLGTYISTKRQREEEMRKQGVTEKGATPKEGQAWV